jgi:hypothetical protein
VAEFWTLGGITRMDNISQSSARPMAVKLALILLAVFTGVAFVMNLIYTQWGNYVADISFGLFLIVYVIPLWFLFRGKNWARWFVAILTFIGVCYSPFLWIQDHQTMPAFWKVWFWLSDLSDIIVMILLFHSSSNRWFRGYQLPSNYSLEPTATAPSLKE